MGLSMNLTAERFFWKDEDSGIKDKLKTIVDTDYDVDTVQMEIGYWRKSNAIHKWFVDNVQHGVDDCSKYSVTEKQLQDLLQITKQAVVSKNPELILPCQSGFFFGLTDYGNYYKEDLNHTIEIIEKWLNFKDKSKYVVHYQSSW